MLRSFWSRVRPHGWLLLCLFGLPVLEAVPLRTLPNLLDWKYARAGLNHASPRADFCAAFRAGAPFQPGEPRVQYCNVERIGSWLERLAILNLLVSFLAGSLLFGLATLAQRRPRSLEPAFSAAWALIVAWCAFTVFSQFCLFGFGLDLLFLLLLDRVSGMLALGPIVGALSLLGLVLWLYATRAARTLRWHGTMISKEERPDLWREVSGLAEALGTREPDQLVAGLAPYWFGTDAEVQLGEKRLSGRTLYLPHSWLALFPRAESCFLLARELGFLRFEELAMPWQKVRRFDRFTEVLQNQSGPLSRIYTAFSNLLLACFRLPLSQLLWNGEQAAHGWASALTNPITAKLALLRLTLFTTAWAELESVALGAGGEPARLRERAIEMATSEGIALGERWAPHPFRPAVPLSQRLRTLEAELEPDDLTDLSLAHPPATTLLEGAVDDQVNRRVAQAGKDELREIVTRRELASADESTPEGRALLELHFPPVDFPEQRPVLIFLGMGATLLSLFLCWFCASGRAQGPRWLHALLMGGSLALALMAWRYAVRHWRAFVRVDWQGVQYSLWSEPVRFRELEQITQNGSALFFISRAAAPRSWIATLLRGDPRVRMLSLSLTKDPREVIRVTDRYFQRQMPD